MKKLTIDEMKSIAESKGGRCLSNEYKNLFSKLKWQCSKGHTWEAIPSNIKHHNKWCPYCAKNARFSLDIAQEIARKKGGQCLSTEYKNMHTKMEWKCAKGHIWKARLHDVKDYNNWCPYCSHHVKLNLEEMKELAKSKGGKCLSTEYINTDSKLLWKCEKGHQWETRPAGVKRGSWCPNCAGNLILSQEIPLL